MAQHRRGRELPHIQHLHTRRQRQAQTLWSYGEGGQQGATGSLITACATIQPALKRLDEKLRPHRGSARKGIEFRIHVEVRKVVEAWDSLLCL